MEKHDFSKHEVMVPDNGDRAARLVLSMRR